MAIMNRIIEEFRKDRERVLDQLVDGALTEEDRKQVLRAIDEEPGAWRRCALAFIEAQTWRGDMLSLRAEAPPKPTIAEPPLDAPNRTLPLGPPRSSRFFEAGLALAACVVLAFGVSVYMRSDTTGRPNGIAGEGTAAHANVVGSYSPWHAKLNYDDPATNGPDSLDVPLVEPQGINKDWMQGQRSALPDDMRRDLEQSGHKVIQRHYLHSTPLKDGRRVLVPVEQIDVEPSPRPTY
jgi:hypothetical protein